MGISKSDIDLDKKWKIQNIVVSGVVNLNFDIYNKDEKEILYNGVLLNNIKLEEIDNKLILKSNKITKVHEIKKQYYKGRVLTITED